MKRYLSWLLALALIVSCLPLSAIPAFAATDPDVDIGDGDDDFTVDFGELTTPAEPELGSEENPITVEWEWNEDQTEATASATVPAGKTLYYQYYGDNTLILTVDGEKYEYTPAAARMYPNTFSLTNETEEDHTYALVLSYPVGTMSNPAQLIIDENNVAVIEAGNNQGYYYTWTALADGVLSITMPFGSDWSYVINNLTSYVYGETYTTVVAEGEEPVYTSEVEVSAGDEIQLIVNTINPEDAWNNPGGTLEIYASFTYPAGSEQNPIILFTENQTETVTVPAGETVWYQAYINGMELTINDGEPKLITTANPRMPYVFSLTEGEYTLTIAYPAGSMQNPAKLVLGDNVANIKAGSEGYYYAWTAEEDGTLIITMKDENWFYVVNNMTTGAYGDTQWSDSDPVVNPAEIEVKAGDEIQVSVNTYDPDDMWTTPEGTITFTAAFQAAGPLVDENLKFQTYALSFQEDISIQFVLRTTVANQYDSVTVECIHEDPVDGTLTENLTGVAKGSAAIQYVKNMKSWSMPDMVTITLYAEKDGVTYKGQSVTTSIELLALDLLAKYSVNASQEKYCPTLADMLNYGAAVQVAYKHNAEDPANADLGEYSRYATVENPALEATNTKTEAGAIKVIRHAISMSSQVQLQTIFAGDVTGYELRYTVDGVTTTISGDQFVAFGSNYQAIVAVKAANMRKVYTIGLYDPATGEAVSAIYTSSVEGFANEQKNGTYSAVIYAMMKYGDSVASLL